MHIMFQVTALLATLELQESARRKGHFALYNCLVLGHTKYSGIQRDYCNLFLEKLFHGSHCMNLVMISRLLPRALHNIRRPNPHPRVAPFCASRLVCYLLPARSLLLAPTPFLLCRSHEQHVHVLYCTSQRFILNFSATRYPRCSSYTRILHVYIVAQIDTLYDITCIIAIIKDNEK